MEDIPTDQFLAFCRALEGCELLTLARKSKFSTYVTAEGLEFLISATGKRRKHTVSYVEAFNKRYCELEHDEALQLKNYNNHTVNASYQLALVVLYRNLKQVFQN